MSNKNYDKFIKELSKNYLFDIKQSSKNNTIKITHISSGKLYSIHPGDKAIHPLRRWIKQFKS